MHLFACGIVIYSRIALESPLQFEFDFPLGFADLASLSDLLGFDILQMTSLVQTWTNQYLGSSDRVVRHFAYLQCFVVGMALWFAVLNPEG